MDSDLSPQDKKDLDKFIKFFALKTVQVIVQARLGEKINTCSSSSPTGSDWFNLAIKDIPEVTHEAKKALAGQLPGIGRSMCVEISLKTSEGDSMELETWCLEMNEKCDKDIKVSYTVYNRLSLLLKSLLAITRVTPAYKLSRKQGHDYVILYRIYFGDVQLTGLGEGFQTVRVGIVGTPIGTITLSCAYRTNLALMSSRYALHLPVCKGLYSITHTTDCLSTAQANAHNHCCLFLELTCLLFYLKNLCVCTDMAKYVSLPNQMVVPGKEGGVPQVPAQPTHGTAAEHGRIPSCPTGQSPQPAPPTSCSSEVKTVSPSDALETTFTRKVGAFVNKATTQVHPPPSPAPSSPLQGSLHSNTSSHSGGLPQDDFVMVDFKPAFSKDDLLPMDLGTFYKEFQNPPQLASLSIDVSVQSMAEDLDSLPEKLAIYEKNIDEFDAFVDTLQ
uniref:Autophagy-related protein 13 n=1 Tax=Sinocyclocheilus grahami TaxID=75366 RepID=A0A672SNJ5_SINGR